MSDNRVATTAPPTDASSDRPAGPAEPAPLPLDLASPQLTIRALLTGMLLGAVLSACNIYSGLKVGWSFNMSITAGLLAFGFWSAMRTLGFRPFGLLENNINQTACSAGAAVSSAGLVAPIPALAMLTGQTLPWHWLALWVFSVCLVGIAAAVPLRRQMILTERLPFATGIATAETLKELYARGVEALRRVLMLFSWALVASAMLLAEHARWIKRLPLPGSIQGFSASSLTFSLDPTLMMYAVGGLVGIRATVSMLIGGVLAWGILAPQLLRSGHIRLTVSEQLDALPDGVQLPPPPAGYLSYDEHRKKLEWSGVMTASERDALLAQSDDPAFQQAVTRLYARSQLDGPPPADPDLKRAQPNFKDLVTWLLWPGVTMMVVASLVSLAFNWRSFVRAFSGGGADVPDGPTGPQPTAGEVTRQWFIAGLLVAFSLSVALQVFLFSIPWWAASLGVLLTFLLAVVAGRVSGETNITPVGAMGKVTQLLFGAMLSGQAAPNLMAANVTGGAASQCADMLHDLKCGYLVGAAARMQTLAQLCGALAGALAGSFVYLVLIPNPREMLITEQWAAPAVATWKAVAELFMVGFAAMPRGTPLAIMIAAAAAVVLVVADKVAPKTWRRFILSPTSIGLAFTIQAHTTLAMFTGAALMLALSRVLPAWSARFATVICAGVIAGESITGVGLSVSQLPLFQRSPG